MDPKFYLNLFTIQKQTLTKAIQGGVIIAVASSIYYFLFGGILGMSGMAGSIIKYPKRHGTVSKAIVILGVLFASALINTFYQKLPEFQDLLELPFDSKKQIKSLSITHLVVAGLLVGVGTQLANGCTSGHGLCGMPRFSIRSFAAVAVFLSTAIATATTSLQKYIPQINLLHLPINLKSIPSEYYLTGSILLLLGFLFLTRQKSFYAKLLLFCIGSLFGCGLMVAGMSKQSKIHNFLVLNKQWDPSLLFVLMTGVLINIFTFNIIKKFVKKPYYGQKIQDPRGNISIRLILGAFLFGIGWGIGGLCPGPFILSIPFSVKIAVYWGIPFFLSQKITSSICQKLQAKQKTH